jgi:diaminopimelate epimerase
LSYLGKDRFDPADQLDCKKTIFQKAIRMRRTENLSFVKMHGLGNDFIILDGRDGSTMPDANQYRALADRHKGIGCDQFMVILPAADAADIQLDMYNADGSVAGACGNGTRCVASLIMAETGKDSVLIRTVAGLLSAHLDPVTGLISVNMGPVHTDGQSIGLTQSVDPLAVDLGLASFGPATALSMGNPHAVFFTEDAESVELEKWGPIAENHEIFANRANIEFVTILGRGAMRMRVWERGVGVTLACGSGACAAAAAGYLRGLTDSDVDVYLDGGRLQISWQNAEDGKGGQVIMTGPVSHVATGVIPATFFETLLADSLSDEAPSL